MKVTKLRRESEKTVVEWFWWVLAQSQYRELASDFKAGNWHWYIFILKPHIFLHFLIKFQVSSASQTLLLSSEAETWIKRPISSRNKLWSYWVSFILLTFVFTWIVCSCNTSFCWPVKNGDGTIVLWCRTNLIFGVFLQQVSFIFSKKKTKKTKKKKKK